MTNQTPNTETIKLTRGMVAIVDSDDLEKLSSCKWYAGNNSGKFYARREIYKDGIKKSLSMHRVIMNAPNGIIVDHINGNTLDNRKENLRFCTVNENQMNRIISKNNTSGYKGVRLADCKTEKWEAHLVFKGKYIYLGLFNTPEEAAIAYNNGATKHFGKFALLNKIKTSNE